MDKQMLSSETVAAYVQSRETLSALIDTGSLTAQEVGDGNLNLVFLCSDDAGRRLVLKQALPYVRLVGPSWPMTVDRAAREAHALETHFEVAPELVCGVIEFNAEDHVLALEDLSDHTVLRTVLNHGGDHAGVFEQMARLVARVLFGTSWLSLGEENFRVQAAATVNSELCVISEELVFTEPFLGGGRNSVHPAIRQFVETLQADAEWIAAAMVMKRRFLSCQEALIHGDLHSGSIFVRGAGADQQSGRPASSDFSVRAFDSEFAFYGPIGFDLGLLWGNILVAAARASTLGDDSRSSSLLDTIESSWQAFESTFRELWPKRRKPEQYPDSFLESWLADIFDDSLGFAGAEACRRIIGLAKVSDIESLPTELYERGSGAVLRLGRSLLVDRSTRDIHSYVDEFHRIVQSYD